VATLGRCRERLWAILSQRCPGTVRTEGAFYFLAKLPQGMDEEEAVRTLATEFRVLCTPGKCVKIIEMVGVARLLTRLC
jgi:aspartate/methionine/tyrosine aminotransferase